VGLGLDWDLPLQHRRGAFTRLCGIDVYYDFEWLDVFPDQRAQFKHGQVLATHICEDCPDGKAPALLLTTREDAYEGPVYTETHYVFVLNLPRYLRQADEDAAVSYLAGRLGSATRIGRLRELAQASPDEILAFHQLSLNADQIAAWAGSDESRLAQLREIAGVRDPVEREITLDDALTTIQALGDLDSEVASAIAGLLGPDTSREVRLKLLRALTDDPTGRHVAGEALGQRTNDRLADARRATSEYVALLEDPSSNETDLQHFIEDNLWLLGLDYSRMRSRQPVARGVMDFILERFDGFHDLLELKSPQDPIIIAPAASEVPPSASSYALSPVLAQALAQVHVYRHTLTAHPEVAEELFGLRHTRDPRVVVVIGKADSMPAHSALVLRELNRSLHRVEIVPYDVLAKRANAILDNVERYVLAAQSEVGTGAEDS
jgi:hypothetical protein